MKRVRQDNKRTKKYIDSLPKIYLVVCWADYGYIAYPNSCKVNKDGIPLVWEYYDGNGTCSEWHLSPITQATTGWVSCWTVSEKAAKRITDAMRICNDLNNILSYKGFRAFVRYNDETKELYGNFKGIKNSPTFSAKDTTSITTEFEKAVDKFIIDNKLELRTTPFGEFVDTSSLEG